MSMLISAFKTIWAVFLHLFHKADTVQYPEEKSYLPPRWRGRIVLTRDPDGEGAAWPVTCVPWPAPWIASPCKLRKTKTGGAILNSSASTFPAVFFAACVKKPAQPTPSSSRPISRWVNTTARIWSTKKKTCSLMAQANIPITTFIASLA